MIYIVVLVSLLTPTVYSQVCQQCQNRRLLPYGGGYQPKNYNFNFEKFFNSFPGYTPQRQPTPQRVFNVYGQDAETFGSAIGKSIGQRIQQVFAQQDPTTPYDIQFTPPTSSGSSSPSYSSPPTQSPTIPASSSSYGSSIPTSYPTSAAPSTYSPTPSAYPSTSWPSTHPPEDLPTVQQAYQQQVYGSTPSLSQPSRPNGFGGLPGMLPPPNDCPWCSQGYRGKRVPDEKQSEKI